MDHYRSSDTAKRYHKTWNDDLLDEEKVRKATERYKKFISYIGQTGHILDAGCSTGRFIRYFLERKYSVTGIDASQEMLKIASQTNPGAEFIEMDLRSLGFPDKTFEGIWNVATLLHLDHEGAKKALFESRRVIKDNGCLYIATRTAVQDAQAEEESTEGGKMQVYYYSPETLEEMLENAGFNIATRSVEPDDSIRPFDYIHIYAMPSR